MQDLEYFGHHHKCKLLDSFERSQPAGQLPLCHYYDVLVEDDVDDRSFLHEIASSNPTDRRPSIRPPEIEHSFVENIERRQNLILEFVNTEESYVASLNIFLKSIVRPIRARAGARGKRASILGPYECGKIFSNIEEVFKASEDFCKDLVSYRDAPVGENFGELCLKHLKGFACYDKFLKGVENAQTFSNKEINSNPQYRTFLEQVENSDKMGNQTVYDYLALPGQRVGRYTMIFKELIKHTQDDDPELSSLIQALEKTEDIAKMAEDHHTKLIRMFHNMLQSIQNCPPSLISEQRRLICHLDAVEVDPKSLKPVNPVTFFLFTDKLMVVRRSSYTTDGLELCGLDNERDKSGIVSLLARKSDANKRAERKLKFRGWVNLNDIEIGEGVPEVPASLTFFTAHTAIQTQNGDNQTRDDDGYFQADRVHLYTISTPTADHQRYANSNPDELSAKRKNFVEQFGRAKFKCVHGDNQLNSAYFYWKGHHFFGTITQMSQYHLAAKKNEIALLYMGNTSLDIKNIFLDCYAIPHVLGFVVHDKDRQYSFSMRSKVNMGSPADDDSATIILDTKKIDFIDRLFCNILKCDFVLRDIGRQTALAEYCQPQNGTTRSVRRSLRLELTRRRSTSTFKLFPGLGSISSSTGASTLGINSQRPRSVSVCGDIGRSYSSGSSSIHTHGSNDSRSTLQSISSSIEEEDEGGANQKLTHHRGNRHSFAHGEKNQIDPSQPRISLHLPQLSPLDFKPKDSLASPPEMSDDLLEERVNILCAQLSQGLDGSTASRASRNIRRLSRTSSAHSSDFGSGFSTVGSRKSTSSPFSSYRGSPLPQENSLIKHPTLNLDRIFADMDQMKNDFDSKWSSMVNGYEEADRTVQSLRTEVEKKDEEIEQLRTKYRDAMTEIDLLYEAFNEELEQIFQLVDSNPQRRSQKESSGDNGDLPQNEDLMKKLEQVLKERNKWQQTACKLIHEKSL